MQLISYKRRVIIYIAFNYIMIHRNEETLLFEFKFKVLLPKLMQYCITK